MIWRIVSHGRFYDAGESTVVYFDLASGDTHLISDFAAYLIQQLAGQPMGIEALVNQISPDIDPDDLPEVTQVTPGVLEELVALDILERG
jgi:hypothetical protein